MQFKKSMIKQLSKFLIISKISLSVILVCILMSSCTNSSNNDKNKQTEINNRINILGSRNPISENEINQLIVDFKSLKSDIINLTNAEVSSGRKEYNNDLTIGQIDQKISQLESRLQNNSQIYDAINKVNELITKEKNINEEQDTYSKENLVKISQKLDLMEQANTILNDLESKANVNNIEGYTLTRLSVNLKLQGLKLLKESLSKINRNEEIRNLENEYHRQNEIVVPTPLP